MSTGGAISSNGGLKMAGKQAKADAGRKQKLVGGNAYQSNLREPGFIRKIDSFQSGPWRYLAPAVPGAAGLTFLIVAAGIGIGWLYTHPPKRYPPSGETLEKMGIPFRRVDLSTCDGLTLSGWYTRGSIPALILVTHGWGSCRSEPIHALIARHGYSVLSWDFRCHGQSQGRSCSAGYYEARDVRAALDFALAEEPSSRIGYWGGSMGGIAGLRSASKRPEIEAMVLDSVPSDIRIPIRKITKIFPINRVAVWAAEGMTGIEAGDIKPLIWLRRFAPRPVFIIQGLQDHRLSRDCCRMLLAAAGENASLWMEPGVGHLKMFEARPEEYRRRVVGFFDRALAQRGEIHDRELAGKLTVAV